MSLQLDRLYVKVNEDGSIDYTSRQEKLDVAVEEDFFSEYSSDYWLYNFETKELELIPNAAELKAAADQSKIDAKVAAELAAKKQELIEAANKAKDKAFYSNVTIPFPVTEHELHFRNELDRSNIRDKVIGAMALAGAGGGDSPYIFSDVNGVEVQMKVSEFISCGLSIMALKDSVHYQFKGVKDAVKAANSLEELALIDLALLGL